jgi:hypothetical protein
LFPPAGTLAVLGDAETAVRVFAGIREVIALPHPVLASMNEKKKERHND